VTEQLRIPPIRIAVCSIVALLPEWRSAKDSSRSRWVLDNQREAGALVGAGAVGRTLAAGVALGQSLGRPICGELDRVDRRPRRRATAAG
jgi:hypothetical protein